MIRGPGQQKKSDVPGGAGGIGAEQFDRRISFKKSTDPNQRKVKSQMLLCLSIAYKPHGQRKIAGEILKGLG